MRSFLLNTVTAPSVHDQVAGFKAPSLLKLGLSFLALMALLVILIWLLKKISSSKLGFFHSDSGMKVLERKALSPKTNLYVLDVHGQKMLITESSLHLKIEPINPDISQTL